MMKASQGFDSFIFFFYMKINEDDIKELISYKVTEKLNFDHNHGL